jgi:hypothetical protein
MHATHRSLAVAALSAALVVTGAPLAFAKGGDGVIRTGSCSGSADWKLKAAHDNGIEVEYEVDSNHVGQTWRVRIRDNGVLVTKTRATTAGRSGSFEISRSIANRAGSDNLVARAYDPASGQTCVGRLSL